MSGSPPRRDGEAGPPVEPVESPRVAGAASGDDAERLIDELKRTKVADLLLQTCSVIASLGFAKLSEEARDLEQCRLAIEALKAIHPLLPEEHARDVRQAVSGLQLAFVDAAGK